ncbi:MAG: gamma-glutamyltransferase [Candidatus Bipolaricaulis sp.]|nr:gamma-glutamyltransferase [Candidatus Bipolaricaulis sp.]
MESTLLPMQGPKESVHGKKAVCSTAHPIVTDTIMKTMKAGGNAVDAAIAGSMVQAAIEPDMSNHAGTVTFLYWEAKSGKAYQLNSTGTLVPGLAPFRPLPSGLGMLVPAGVEPAPCACIPGFMPGMKALFERFGTRPWSTLCEDAILWAEEGHPVSSFEFGVLESEMPSHAYFPESRALFMPDGHTPQVGERFRNPKLAATLRRVAKEGPDDFLTGVWAQHFVKHANDLGWPIELRHMTAIPPRWQEPLRYPHRGYEVLQLSPPERTGLFSAFVLGILAHLDVTKLGHYTESAEALYYMAHALRWVDNELVYLQDPLIWDVPLDPWLSGDYHRMVAGVLRHSKPKIDLTEHLRLYYGVPRLAATGLPIAGPGKPRPPIGSCELSIVDPEGNWVQMMHTMQSGGIPGAVVDGVPMNGSNAVPTMKSRLCVSGWLTGGGRIRCVIGNTIVLKDGKPWLSLGTPGNVHVTVPQVLSNILDYGYEPYEASVLPRMLPLRDDYVLEIESRLPAKVVSDLARLGIIIHPLAPYDYHKGSYQICWKHPTTGTLSACTDPRRCGKADGF